MKRHHWVATVLAVVAVLALALVFAWSDRSPNAARTASAPAASAPADAGQRHACRVAKFETVDGAYADAAPPCAGINGGLRARDRAIQAGTVAITTWKHHIRDMEMLRTGQITPQQATQMWLRNWHLGVRQLDTFTNARDSAVRAGRC